MKVLALPAFGSIPVLTDIAVPEPGVGEVRVRVRAASVNGFDVAVANGYLQGAMEHRFPVVLGKDFAGTIDALGDGVDIFAIGDRVFGVVTKDFLGDGSFGEFVTVPAAVGIATIPDGVDFADAAALGLAGTAATDSIDAAALFAGATVLIAGATGGVGQQAAQLAAKAGADVIGTAHTADEVAALAALGVTRTVDHTGDVAQQIRDLHPAGVDVVLHFAGDPGVLAPLVASGGVFVSTLVQDAAQVPVDGIRIAPIYAQPTAETLARVADRHADGTTGVSTQRTYRFDEAASALTDFAGGTLGKLVISIG